jgi:hypothetical protein
MSKNAEILWPASGAIAGLIAVLYFVFFMFSADLVGAAEGSVFFGVVFSFLWIVWMSVRLRSFIPLCALPLGFLGAMLLQIVGVFIAGRIQGISVGDPLIREAVSYLLVVTPMILVLLYSFRETIAEISRIRGNLISPRSANEIHR